MFTLSSYGICLNKKKSFSPILIRLLHKVLFSIFIISYFISNQFSSGYETLFYRWCGGKWDDVEGIVHISANIRIRNTPYLIQSVYENILEVFLSLLFYFICTISTVVLGRCLLASLGFGFNLFSVWFEINREEWMCIGNLLAYRIYVDALIMHYYIVPSSL